MYYSLKPTHFMKLQFSRRTPSFLFCKFSPQYIQVNFSRLFPGQKATDYKGLLKKSFIFTNRYSDIEKKEDTSKACLLKRLR